MTIVFVKMVGMMITPIAFAMMVRVMNMKLLVMNIAFCHNGEDNEYEAFSDEYCICHCNGELSMMNRTCQKQGLSIASARVVGAGQWRSVHQSSLYLPNIRNNLAFAFFSDFSITFLYISQSSVLDLSSIWF